MRPCLRKCAHIVLGARAGGQHATVRLGTVVGAAVVTVVAALVAGIWLSGEGGSNPSPRNGAIAFVILSVPVGIYLGWRLSPPVARGQSTVRLTVEFALGLALGGAIWIGVLLGLLASAFVISGNPVVGAVAAVPLFVGTTLFYCGFLLLFFGLPAFLIGIPAGLVWATTVRLFARRHREPD